MNKQLQIRIGQHSDKGRKPVNQDFHGVTLPLGPELQSKGIALAIADGISSSEVSHIASESAVTGFLEDYYGTTDTWSVKTSVERVLTAINTWLYSQTRQNCYEDNDHGYVCTLTALVLKANAAHLFHVGDSRIYRINVDGVEQLTEDHRIQRSSQRSYLARALGINHRLDIDYRQIALEVGDIFLLATDGVYEFLHPEVFSQELKAADADLEAIARAMVEQALSQGSDDNLTIQIVRIESLPDMASSEMTQQLATLPCPPPLGTGIIIDGLKILHEIRIGSRSHVYLAENTDNGKKFVLKAPSTGMRDDRAYLERFLVEDWIAQRLDNPHIVRPYLTHKAKSSIYVATEYVEGQSLAQWMRNNPKPDLVALREYMTQIARGLRAFHRLEMLHQDLKPDNILIDRHGTLKIIDFGAARVAGMAEAASGLDQINLLGAAQYAAPEYFLGESGSPRSDLYSLGVIAYQMLSGRLPYGDAVPKIRTIKARDKLKYVSLKHWDSTIPYWIDAAINKAVHPDPQQRHSEMSEFIHDLGHANPAFVAHRIRPLMHRNPLRFWQLLSLILVCLVVALGLRLAAH